MMGMTAMMGKFHAPVVVGFFTVAAPPGFFDLRSQNLGGGTTFVGSEPWRDAPYFEETKSCLVETPGGKGAR